MFQIRGDIVTPERILAAGVIAIDDRGTIRDIGAGPGSGRRSMDIDASGLLVVPGFIDMHVHGGGGADFMSGMQAAARQIARTHAGFGTTALLATTLTASADRIDCVIQSARGVMGDRAPDEAAIVGIHLEGPYICDARRGAQPAAFIRDPDPAELERWIKLGDGALKQITIAPERPGAQDVIRMAARAGMVVSIGHTDAAYDDMRNAAEWGASQVTHVFNAMRGIHHREPGAAGAALAMDVYTVEVIADGVHLHPMIVKLVVEAKGADTVVLITDAIEGAAMPDGSYALGDTPIRVKDGVASFDDGTLAGSVLTMNRAFANVQRFTGVSPVVAARFAATNAARQLQDSARGKLEPGKRADIAILDPGTGDVHWTIVDGQIAYKR